MSRHINIPIFIPHLGCPNNCAFCNQKSIAGVSDFDPSSTKAIIDNALTTVSDTDIVEIAFFGGSFTGIDRELMLYLLDIAKSYVDDGRVFGIRCSTRPDYISDEILDILAPYPIKTIELGMQSCVDNVLCASKRGHTSQDIMKAARLIKSRGINLVGQMMIGLPESDFHDEIYTAERIIEMGCDAARIYPTVVFKDTELAIMLETGSYKALSVEDAVLRSAEVLKRFVDAGIPVIKIGLHASESLTSSDKCVGGPNHPALGELIQNRVYYLLIKEYLSANRNIKEVVVRVPKGSLSKVIGHNKKNKEQLTKEFGLSVLRFTEDANLREYELIFN